jgi:glycosyltransferase involved in cell wall biosynthesis
MPSYNQGRFLGPAIESVLAQTFPSLELVIVDDGSSDDSLAIARGYASRYPDKVRVLTHAGEAHRGPGATMNLATMKCRGAFRSSLASDDLYLPRRIETHYRYLEPRSGLDWVYGPVAAIDAEGKRIDLPLGYNINSVEDATGAFIERNPCNGIAVLARMEAIRRIEGHAVDILYSDWDFWFRLFLAARPAYLDEVLVLKRVHGANASIVSPEKRARQAAELFRHLLVSAGAALPPRHRALIHLQLCHRSFMLGESDRAHAHLQDAFREDPELGRDPRWIAYWLVRRYTRDGIGADLKAGDVFADWLPEEVGRRTDVATGAAVRERSRGPLLEFRAKTAYGQGQYALCRSLIREGLQRAFRNPGLVKLYAFALAKQCLVHSRRGAATTR